MIWRAWIVLGLGCAFSEADIIANGLEHIETLSQMTAAQKEQVSRMVLQSQNLLIQHHQTHTYSINQTTLFHTDMAIKKAQALNCHPSVLENIEMISKKTLTGWQSCLNVSQPLGEMIQLGIDFTESLATAENIICSGIKNVTLCNETGIYDKFVCVSNAMEKATSDYITNTKGVLYWIKQLIVVFEDLGSKIAQCLDITKINLFTDLESQFDDRCRRSAPV